MDDVFSEIEPNEEQIKLFDKWSAITYKEDQEMQQEMAKGFVHDMVAEILGIDLDLDEIDFKNPDFSDVEEQLRQKMSEVDRKKLHKQTSKKQTLQAKKEQAKEDLKTKSIRSIYITLVKVLHPDLESNDSKRLQKQELMKNVTKAYEEKDLATLLQIQATWLGENGDVLPEQQLKIYNAVLKEQIDELKRELFSLRYNPFYENISGYIHFKEKAFERELLKIEKEQNQLEQVIENYIF